MAMASSVELYANCRCRGQQGLDVPHDKPLKALHNDGCECNGLVVIEARHCGLLRHGTMVMALRHVGTNCDGINSTAGKLSILIFPNHNTQKWNNQ